jgi:MULE transposase domain
MSMDVDVDEMMMSDKSSVEEEEVRRTYETRSATKRRKSIVQTIVRRKRDKRRLSMDVDEMMMQSDESSDEEEAGQGNVDDFVLNDEDAEEEEEDEEIISVQRNDSFVQMREKTFPNRKSMENFIREFYIAKALVLKIGKHSDKTRLSMKCLAGSKYKSQGFGVRETTTRLNNCPFEVFGRYHERTGCWRITKLNENHNHPYSASFVENRRFTEQEVSYIRSSARMGVTATAILLQLQDRFGNKKSTMKDIQNEIQRYRIEYLRGRTPIIALRDSLNTENFMFNIDMCPTTNKVRSLFFAPHESVLLARRFNTCFIMDCTYKTNRFGMPLFNIVGFTCTYKTFNVGFVFMSNELECNYCWALREFKKITEPKVICTDRELALMNAIGIVFPNTKNLLCIWHINKNILANCKKRFSTDEAWFRFTRQWNLCCFSETEKVFKENWEELLQLGDPTTIQYIEDTWMVHKERFVKYYCDECQHMGSTATSRAEGNHSVLKKFIRNSNGDLLMVKSRLCLMWRQQLQTIIVDMEQNKIIINTKYRECELFSEIIGYVSTFAMEKIFKQLMSKETAVCTGKFRSVWGLPCKHEINEMETVSINKEMIHSQWHLDAIDNANFFTRLTRNDEGDEILFCQEVDNNENEIGSIEVRTENNNEVQAENVDGLIEVQTDGLIEVQTDNNEVQVENIEERTEIENVNYLIEVRMENVEERTEKANENDKIEVQTENEDEYENVEIRTDKANEKDKIEVQTENGDEYENVEIRTDKANEKDKIEVQTENGDEYENVEIRTDKANENDKNEVQTEIDEEYENVEIGTENNNEEESIQIRTEKDNENEKNEVLTEIDNENENNNENEMMALDDDERKNSNKVSFVILFKIYIEKVGSDFYLFFFFPLREETRRKIR